MLTVHMIFHAHLDPIWLWPWTAGVDEALSTCRSACERLEAHPDLYFSQGEAWVYHQVQKLDPGLFKRIREFVEAGRWEIVGGWWTQPDCNFPDRIGLERQIQMGREYFMDEFGMFPDIAFNPDSFGHNASLPRLMNAVGQTKYVFMRPQEHELTLPGRLFNWHGLGGGKMTAFRVARAYCCGEIRADFVKASIDGLPEGIKHTACFCGVGDHGGGPTEYQIRQIRELMETEQDVKIEFSTAKRFFDAIADKVDTLPIVEGELQHHAIGCYTVHRPGKTALKAATQRLRQLETAFENNSSLATEANKTQLRDHWRNVVFHQFHDTLGGTCLPSAYKHVEQELGAAEAWATTLLNDELRIKMQALPDDEKQRVLVYNPSDAPYDGWFECEPWFGHRRWEQDYCFADEDGKLIRFQKIQNESLTGGSRFALRLQLAPGELKVLKVARRSEVEDDLESLESIMGSTYCMGNDNGAAIALYPPEMVIGSWILPFPEIISYPDNSDTWSHGIDRYVEDKEELPTWGTPVLLNDGPYLREIVQKGRIGNSDLYRSFRLYADSGDVEMRIRVNWQERNRVLKLVMPYEAYVDQRLDGIPGGWLERNQDGAERPIRDWTRISLEEDEFLGIVSPDIFALDATVDRARLTLLRSPQMAHHDPYPGGRVDGRFSDRGEHDFTVRFMAGKQVTPEVLDQVATMMQRTPLNADLTRGMKPL